MSKPNSNSLTTALLKESTHLCRCLTLHPENAAPLGLTDHDEDILFQDCLHHAEGGMLSSAVDQSADLARDGLEIQAILSSSRLTETDLIKGTYDGAVFYLWLVDWQNPSNATLLSRGYFGAVQRHGKKFSVNLEGPVAALQQKTGKVFQNDCDAILGDSRCRVFLDAAKWNATGSIIKAEQRKITLPNLPAFENAMFTHGQLKFTSGALADTQATIREDAIQGGERMLVLWEGLPLVPAIGDTVELTAGCDKQFSTCRQKFSNVINFQGMPHIPSKQLLVKATDS